MDQSSLIATLSFLAALLAALYSRWVWSEARRTNLLALHTNRIAVFRAFHRLRQSVQARGVGIEHDLVDPFYQFARESKFYFSETKTSELLAKYCVACFELAEVSRKLERSGLAEAEREHLHDRQDAMSDLEQSLFSETEKQLESELCHAVRRGWFGA